MLLMSILAACTNSGLGKPTGTTGDTGPDTTVTGVQNCPWVGSWELSDFKCNTFPYDAWYDTHDTATMEITHDPAGGCTVVTTIAGAECTRLEGWQFSVPVGTSVDVTMNGVTDCEPNKCKFDPADVDEPECSEGALTAPAANYTIDDSTGDLTAVGLLADTAPGCTLDVVTVWSAAR